MLCVYGGVYAGVLKSTDNADDQRSSSSWSVRSGPYEYSEIRKIRIDVAHTHEEITESSSEW